ncbi:MAG TPA: hypothetical protein VGG99_10285 [Acetobacteraceae bacterium]|jgi:hypothetical protein
MVHVIERQTRADTAGPANRGPIDVRTRQSYLSTLFGLPARPAAAAVDMARFPQDDMRAARGIGLAAGIGLAIWSAIAVALYFLM